MIIIFLSYASAFRVFIWYVKRFDNYPTRISSPFIYSRVCLKWHSIQMLVIIWITSRYLFFKIIFYFIWIYDWLNNWFLWRLSIKYFTVNTNIYKIFIFNNLIKYNRLVNWNIVNLLIVIFKVTFFKLFEIINLIYF